MEDGKLENESKDDINFQEATLTDLPASDEQADEIKGGAVYGRLLVGNDFGLYRA